MFKNTRLHLIPVLVIALAGPALAATDPTLSQVYQAARAGRVTQAQQMMSQVLHDHPTSAKAHYVAAELYAREHNTAMARQELQNAETLQPGLPFAEAASIGALRRELLQGQPGNARSAHSQTHSWFPWGAVVLVVGGVSLLWLVSRRRRPPGDVYPAFPVQYPGGMPTALGGPMSPAGPAVAPSIGTGIAGGLASGLAVGAGVVGGEEIARHFLESGRQEGSAPAAANERIGDPDNNDPGDQDFGIPDGSSWDDDPNGLSGDDGGDDWT